MYDEIDIRTLDECDYIIENNATIRETAKFFSVSKSTVHIDVTERIWLLKPSVAGKVRDILDFNKSEAHIRGGLSTGAKLSKAD